MTSVANPTPATTTPVQSPKEQFLAAFEREHQTTLRVLRAFPTDKSELTPHPKLKTARELAWIFVAEMMMAEMAITTGFDWSKPGSMPPAPDSMDAVIAAYEGAHKRVVELVKNMSDPSCFDTVQFPTAPKTMGDWPKIQFLWFLLSDQIHHRGQFSVYLRIAGAKVPSIYGPTADEPWM